MKIVHTRIITRNAMLVSNENLRELLDREDQAGIEFVEKQIFPLVPDCCRSVHIAYTQENDDRILQFYLQCDGSRS